MKIQRHFLLGIMLVVLCNTVFGQTVQSQKGADQNSPPVEYRAGIRLPMENAVTITQVRPNKILYAQGESATVTIKLTNTTTKNQTGTLVCEQRWDLDEKKPLGEFQITIPANHTSTHTVSFNVGPEAFGREFRAEFIQDGKTIDVWSEFYSAMDEWMRVHIISASREYTQHDTTPFAIYGNLRHYFASMPSDFGYGAPKENMWLSGQCQYHINKQAKINEIKHWRRFGIKHTFYVNACYGGQAGYEIMRRHPEWNIYEKNGQPQSDPIYGGYPNPLELASSIEIDPAIVAKDTTKISSWYHGTVNFSDINSVKYGTDEIIKSIDMFDWDGVFWDGHWSHRTGMDYRNQSIIRDEKEKDNINARNIDYITQRLQVRKPGFATWYNWPRGGRKGKRVVIEDVLFSSYLGGEKQFETASRIPNSCMLNETTRFDNKNWKDSFLNMLDNRDGVVQEHGSTHDIGYLWWPMPGEKPGPTRWGWVFHNHLGAQLIASQFHPIVSYNPAWRPTLQFMTRYSALLWAKNVRTIPSPEKVVQVSSSRDVWWKDTVYIRKTADYTDYIIHVLSEPETINAIMEYPTDPPMVKGAEISLILSENQIAKEAWTLRPYDFNELQLPIQQTIAMVSEENKVRVILPEFRYNCIIVLRVLTGDLKKIKKE